MCALSRSRGGSFSLPCVRLLAIHGNPLSVRVRVWRGRSRVTALHLRPPLLPGPSCDVQLAGPIIPGPAFHWTLSQRSMAGAPFWLVIGPRPTSPPRTRWMEPLEAGQVLRSAAEIHVNSAITINLSEREGLLWFTSCVGSARREPRDCYEALTCDRVRAREMKCGT